MKKIISFLISVLLFVIGVSLTLLILWLGWKAVYWFTTWSMESMDLLSDDNLEPGSAKYHLDKAIEYDNKATKILNQQGGFESISSEDMNKAIQFRKKALEQAKKVDASKFNPPFEDKFKNKYIKGLELFIEGHQERDNQKFLKGQKLLDEWTEWFSQERKNNQ